MSAPLAGPIRDPSEKRVGPCPYPGPSPFARGEASYFFGRESEARTLASLVIAHPVVLLYAQSGAGKTSLIQARLVPSLEARGCEVLGPTRVGATLPADVASVTTNVFRAGALVGLERKGANLGELVAMTLQQYLASIPHPAVSEGDAPAPRVLIFDQFEELFTSYEAHWKERDAFFDELADAVYGDVRLRVLFAMREEYIGSLSPRASRLPEQLRTRMRLERLSEDAALEAVTGPLTNSGRSFAAGSAKKLVANLRTVPLQSPEGTVQVVGEFVEPMHLQIACRGLWERLPAKARVIDVDSIDGGGSVDDILSRYYEDCLAKTVARTSATEAVLRRWFQEELITKEGTRGTVYRGAKATGSLPNPAVDALESMRLVRPEPRAGALWYELTHDRFIQPIRHSNTASSVRRGAWGLVLEGRAERWEEAGSKDVGLLKDSEIAPARLWIDSDEAASCEPRKVKRIRTYVDTSARAIARRSSRQDQRSRAVVAALVILFGALTTYSWKKRGEAVDQAKAASKAEQSERAELQRLVATKLSDAARDAFLKNDVEGATALAAQALRTSRDPSLVRDAEEILTSAQITRKTTLAERITPSSLFLISKDALGIVGHLRLRVVSVAPGPHDPRDPVDARSAPIAAAFLPDAGSVRVWERADGVWTWDLATGAIALAAANAPLGEDTAARYFPLAVFDRSGTYGAVLTGPPDRPLGASPGQRPRLAFFDGSPEPKPIPVLDVNIAEEGVKALSISSGPRAAIGGTGGNIEFCDFDRSHDQWHCTPPVLAHEGGVFTVDSTQERTVSGGNRGPVKLWEHGAMVRTFDPGRGDGAWQLVRISDDGTRVGAVREDDLVVVWNADTGETEFISAFLRPSEPSAFSNNVDVLASVTDFEVRLSELGRPDLGQLVGTTPLPGAVDYLRALGNTVPGLRDAVDAAKKGDIDAGVEQLTRARAWPGVDVGTGETALRQEARRIYRDNVESLLEGDAKGPVSAGDVEKVDQQIHGAEDKLKDWAGLSLDDKRVRKLRTDALVARALRKRWGDALPEAVQSINEAIAKDPQVDVSAGLVTALCWQGVLAHADGAPDLCESAVRLFPDGTASRDARGVGRALRGDAAGAIEDFTFFLDHVGKYAWTAETIQRHTAWIQQLRAGKALIPTDFGGR